MTIKGKTDQFGSADHFDTYVACLECGKEFGYDWRQMRRLGPLQNVANERTWTTNYWMEFTNHLLEIGSSATSFGVVPVWEKYILKVFRKTA